MDKAKNATGDAVRARFVKYVCESLSNRRVDFIQKRNAHQENELYWENENCLHFAKGLCTATDEYFPQYLENERLARAIQILTSKERQVLILRCIQDLPFQQIADRLHLSYKGTAAIYYRAISKIRKRMEVK